MGHAPRSAIKPRANSDVTQATDSTTSAVKDTGKGSGCGSSSDHTSNVARYHDNPKCLKIAEAQKLALPQFLKSDQGRFLCGTSSKVEGHPCECRCASCAHFSLTSSAFQRATVMSPVIIITNSVERRLRSHFLNRHEFGQSFHGSYRPPAWSFVTVGDHTLSDFR